MSLTDEPRVSPEQNNDNMAEIAFRVDEQFGYASVLEIVGPEEAGRPFGFERNTGDTSTRVTPIEAHRHKLHTLLGDIEKSQDGPTVSDLVSLLSYRLLEEHELHTQSDPTFIHEIADRLVSLADDLSPDANKIYFDIGNVDLELVDSGRYEALFDDLAIMNMRYQAHERAGYRDLFLLFRQVWATTVLAVSAIDKNN